MDILDKYNIPIWDGSPPQVDMEDIVLWCGSELHKRFINQYPHLKDAATVDANIIRQFLERNG